ncbi:MAG: response regulator transcription factor [Gemmatimonadetes bacterium]|nr:response regulator transcription factor [Gemmatimonadota bacterium]
MKVLVVDDDPDVVEAVNICFALRWPDAEVLEAPDGATALDRVDKDEPDIVILDLGLPDIDGLEVLEEIRKSSQVPVLILTARGSEVNKVKGLEQGADDYITKPFSHIELLARIRAVLRRTSAPAPASDEEPFEIGGMRFDFRTRRVTFEGERIQLTPIEYSLLYHLTKNWPRVVPHRTLLAKVWGREYVDETDYLKVYIQRIRAKFALVAPDAAPIATERGVGYRLALTKSDA